MKLIEGGNLADRISDFAGDPEATARLMATVARAVDLAHRKGIVHRDLKPANILIDAAAQPHVSDFGLAKELGSGDELTKSGAIMGTPSYMSPEQVQGVAITGRADQFSLAVIAYEVMTGEKPFAAEYLPTLLYKIVREEPLAAQRLNPTLGPQVDTVLHKALSKNPDDRYENCTEFINALSTACTAMPGWTPLPRGASLNMPTGGSLSGLGATIDDAHQPTVDLTMPPAPPPIEVQPPIEAPPTFEPRARRYASDRSNKVIRRMFLSAVVVALLLIGIFFVIQKFASHGSPRQAAVAPPIPQPQEAIPPPLDKSVETPKTEDPPATAPVPTEPVASKPDPSVHRTAVQQPSEFEFQVTTLPAEANVVFDGDPATRCKSPCNASLAGGRHTFVAQLAGYRDEHRIIEVPRDVGLIVGMVKQMGSLSLITNPPGLTVVVDGKEQAQKTPAKLTLGVGSHHVQVMKGSDKQEFTVDIRDGLLSSKFIEWTP
jgi:serine/threonine protein kinase